jgi:hypothetical protein
MVDKTLKISQIGGHGISGLVTLYESLKQNNPYLSNGKIEVTVFDKLKGYGGPAWSNDLPLNKYLEDTWTNTDTPATDLTKDKLFKDFLDAFFNENPENKLVKEGFVSIDRIKEFKNKYGKPEILENLKNNYNDTIARIANGEELKYFAPRGVNGLFAEVINDNIEKIVRNSNGKIDLNFIHGEVLEVTNSVNGEHTLKYKNFESDTESEIATNKILYHGGDSKRVLIEDKNGEVLNNEFVLQNPLTEELKTAVDAAIQKAKDEGRDTIFVAFKGFGNTGQDTLKYIFERAKEAGLKVKATIATRNTNYNSTHPVGKPDKDLENELSGKLLNAKTAQERWGIANNYLDKAPIIKGTVIHADGSEPGEKYNEEKHKGKTRGHVALIIRSTLNKNGKLDEGEYSNMLGNGFKEEFEEVFGIYRAFRNPTTDRLFNFIKENIISGAIKLFGGKFENIEFGASGFSVDVGNNETGTSERQNFDLIVNAVDAKIDLRKNTLAQSFEKFSLAVIDEVTGFFKTKPGTSILLDKEGKQLKSDLIVTNPVTALEQNGLSNRVVFVQQAIADLSNSISEFLTNTRNKLSFSTAAKGENLFPKAPLANITLGASAPSNVIKFSPNISF